MANKNNLTRFIKAQQGVYEEALNEIRNGKKTGHWMWFIFPQIRGLGVSERSRFYAIKSQSEAVLYLNHKILGKRLVEISTALLNLETTNALAVFGYTDHIKLRSSMTLFSLLEPSNPVFQKVLDRFYSGLKDEKTVALLRANA